MNSTYNRIAGQSAERLAALSDGLFGVAMTLLLLELRVPARELIHSEGDLRHALVGLAPQLLVYLMSFMTLGIFWVGQQTQLNYLARSDRDLTWIHMGFLFAVTIMPFSTRLLIEFLPSHYRTALVEYWANILVLGAALYFSWGYATRAGLVREDVPAEVPAAICRRISLRSRCMHSARCCACLTPTGASRSSCWCSSVMPLGCAGRNAGTYWVSGQRAYNFDMRGAKLVVVQTFGGRVEADLAQSRLEAEGMAAMVQADTAGGMRDHLAWSGGGFRVLVREEDEGAAREALSPPDPEEPRDEKEATPEERDAAERLLQGLQKLR